MVEVFMLGILCSIVKLAHLASLVVGPALWAFGALMVLIAAAVGCFEPAEYWARVRRASGASASAERRPAWP
jgi:paraquat-inducible protein A